VTQLWTPARLPADIDGFVSAACGEVNQLALATRTIRATNAVRPVATRGSRVTRERVGDEALTRPLDLGRSRCRRFDDISIVLAPTASAELQRRRRRLDSAKATAQSARPGIGPAPARG
jgi:hypothetical protein